jgi:hypothetical protein
MAYRKRTLKSADISSLKNIIVDTVIFGNAIQIDVYRSPSGRLRLMHQRFELYLSCIHVFKVIKFNLPQEVLTELQLRATAEEI